MNLYYKANTLAVINRETLELEDEIVFAGELLNINEKDGKVYAVSDKGLYEVDFAGKTYIPKLKFDDCVDSHSYYVYDDYFLDGKCYVFLRHDKVSNGNRNEYGDMLKIDMDTLEVESSTPISCSKNTYLENIFILPASYMRENE